MSKQVQVLLPNDHFINEKLFDYLSAELDINGLAQFVGRDSTLYLFRALSKKVGKIVAEMENLGVGVEFGTIDVIPLTTTKPKLTNQTRKRYRLTDKIAMEEMYDFVDSQLHLTFDYLSLILISSIIAAVGLLTNSAVTIVAAMIIDPFMGPILGMTFGTVIKDRTMFLKGLRNEWIGVLITFIIGLPLGVVGYTAGIQWGSFEMMDRGNKESLYGGIVVAICSGLGLGFSTTMGGTATLVGVAISASLLPPVVNSGMNVGYGCCIIWLANDYTTGLKWLQVALISFLLFLANLFLIYFFGLLVFKLKQIKKNSVEPPSQIVLENLLN